MAFVTYHLCSCRRSSSLGHTREMVAFSCFTLTLCKLGCSNVYMLTCPCGVWCGAEKLGAFHRTFDTSVQGINHLYMYVDKCEPNTSAFSSFQSFFQKMRHLSCKICYQGAIHADKAVVMKDCHRVGLWLRSLVERMKDCGWGWKDVCYCV